MSRILTLISVFVVPLSLFTIIAYSSSGGQSPEQAQSSTAAPAQQTNTEQKPVPEPATGTTAQAATRAPGTGAQTRAF